MRTIVILLFMFAFRGNCFTDHFGSKSYYCRDLNRQSKVVIDQLDGLWYQIEKIFHNEERHHRVILSTCPVVYISKDRATTPNPLDTIYRTTYGARYPYSQNSGNPSESGVGYGSMDSRAQDEYDRRTTYDPDRRHNFRLRHMNLYFVEKYLKLSISDGISSMQYQLRYNTSSPSFWVISGPDDGIQDNLKHFTGVIQVIKAVGDHLVLNVCTSHNEERYTLILSREKYLEKLHIQSIHSIILKMGLKTNFIEQSCNHGVSTSINLKLSLLIMVTYLLFL